MSKFLLDTNILFDALLGVEPARAELRRAARPWISRISWIDVLTAAPEQALWATEQFLGRFSVIELSEEIAQRAAAIRRERPAMHLQDAITWASAQVSGRTLVTRNTQDFPASLPGIRVPYRI